MPLRLRLALLFALATALAIAVGGALFLRQLADNLEDTLDNGLRARLAATTQELGTDGTLPALGPGKEYALVQDLNGTVVTATPSASGLALSPPQRRQALAGEVAFTTDAPGARTRVLAASAPLGAGRVLVVVGTGTDVADGAFERVRAALIGLGPIAVALAGLAAWVLAAAALRPVEQMRREAASISEYDPERRLAVPATRDEVAALGTTMNSLLSRLQEALGRDRRFIADASHEIRTPLAILRTELELAARPGRSPEALRQAISAAGLETDRLIRLAEDLLLLARADNHQPILHVAAVQLRELLSTGVRRGRARDHQPPVELECPRDLLVTIDADRLLQAVDNLLDNAILHTPPDTLVRLIASEDDGGVIIEVVDTGPGLPPEFLPRAFERFRRVEHARSRDTGGTGLGLSIVRSIAQAHGGSATIENRPGGGARATVRLPHATTAER
ncbi:MAG: HAMP domain-containing histidine kinase [Actinomycetota bacterium]|nr:HAMP domain-containing histidine kinase [Actinomycetota bacterium]